jgi:glycosyltransferase involved in cell wall biosynthesis
MLCEQQAKANEITVLTSNSKDYPAGNMGRPGDHYIKKRTETIEGVRVVRFPIMPLVASVLTKMQHGVRSVLANSLRYEPVDYMRIFGWGPITPTMYYYIARSDYDFVHAAIWPTTTLFLAFQACKNYKIPFVITPFYHYLASDFTCSSVFRRMLPWCTTVIAVTNSERRELIKIGASPKRTFVVPLSLDVSSVSFGNRDRFRRKYDLEGRFVVLTHPWPGKGGVVVLQGLKLLSKNLSNLALVTFGEPEKKFMQALASNAPLSFPVINLGWVYGEAKWDAYAGSDVFAMPSASDAFGMAYLEAWASGKPVLAARNTCAQDIIKNGKDGFLVDRNSVNDVSVKLSVFARNPSLAEQMGYAGKARVERSFTPSRMSNLFSDAVDESLKLGLP